ncbi:DMT family transporter [Actinospongicola halichondriae]|uniref:DMT family transporter n=1 Tax=Actinospongicola halichondriae TaxID=3236844 RepID=UPI003D414EE8
MDSTDGERRNTAGTLAVSGAMVAFGVNNVIVRTTNFSGVVTASYRLFLGIALLVALLTAMGRRPTLEGIRVAVPAGIAYGGSILFFFSAFKETSIANATLIAALQSGLSLTLVGRFFGEKVRLPEVLLTLVATAGVLLVIVGGESGGAGDIHGDLLAVGGMLSNTVYFVLGKRSRERSDVAAGSFQVGLLTVAAVMTVPVVLLSGDVPTPDGGDWLRLLALAVGGTLGHLGVNWAHRHVTLTTASLLTLAVPVVSSTVAWFVLDEYLSALQWVGASITLAALAAVVLRAVRPTVEDPVG